MARKVQGQNPVWLRPALKQAEKTDAKQGDAKVKTGRADAADASPSSFQKPNALATAVAVADALLRPAQAQSPSRLMAVVDTLQTAVSTLRSEDPGVTADQKVLALTSAIAEVLRAVDAISDVVTGELRVGRPPANAPPSTLVYREDRQLPGGQVLISAAELGASGKGWHEARMLTSYRAAAQAAGVPVPNRDTLRRALAAGGELTVVVEPRDGTVVGGAESRLEGTVGRIDRLWMQGPAGNRDALLSRLVEALRQQGATQVLLDGQALPLGESAVAPPANVLEPSSESSARGDEVRSLPVQGTPIPEVVTDVAPSRSMAPRSEAPDGVSREGQTIGPFLVTELERRANSRTEVMTVAERLALWVDRNPAFRSAGPGSLPFAVVEQLAPEMMRLQSLVEGPQASPRGAAGPTNEEARFEEMNQVGQGVLQVYLRDGGNVPEADERALREALSTYARGGSLTPAQSLRFASIAWFNGEDRQSTMADEVVSAVGGMLDQLSSQPVGDAQRIADVQQVGQGLLQRLREVPLDEAGRASLRELLGRISQGDLDVADLLQVSQLWSRQGASFAPPGTFLGDLLAAELPVVRRHLQELTVAEERADQPNGDPRAMERVYQLRSRLESEVAAVRNIIRQVDDGLVLDERAMARVRSLFAAGASTGGLAASQAMELQLALTLPAEQWAPGSLMEQAAALFGRAADEVDQRLAASAGELSNTVPRADDVAVPRLRSRRAQIENGFFQQIVPGLQLRSGPTDPQTAEAVLDLCRQMLAGEGFDAAQALTLQALFRSTAAELADPSSLANAVLSTLRDRLDDISQRLEQVSGIAANLRGPTADLRMALLQDEGERTLQLALFLLERAPGEQAAQADVRALLQEISQRREVLGSDLVRANLLLPSPGAVNRYVSTVQETRLPALLAAEREFEQAVPEPTRGNEQALEDLRQMADDLYRMTYGSLALLNTMVPRPGMSSEA